MVLLEIELNGLILLRGIELPRKTGLQTVN